MKKSFVIIFTAALIVLISGCNKTNDNGPGRLVINVTDSPFPINFVEYATVTISKVEIRKAGGCDCDDNPFLVVLEDTITFNLLELRNGIVEKLLDEEI